MPTSPLSRVVHSLRHLFHPSPEGETDGQLLERFAAGREEDAFTALVGRHGALVFGLCRRLLDDEHDAEDAFQATFLVLARKAGSIRKRASVGSWLYGVAYRTARKARAEAARRRAREREVAAMSSQDPVAELLGRELRPVLDEEVNRLPEKYRAPVVLCYLEQRTNAEAARALGWTKGTVSGRLARARELLRSRLTRRGLTLTGTALATALAREAAGAAPASLQAATVKAAAVFAAGPAAAGAVSAPVAALVEGVLRAMMMTKVKIAAAVVLTITLLGAGTAVLIRPALAARENTRASARPRAERDDLARLQGTWQAVSVVNNGHALSATLVRDYRLRIAGNRITLGVNVYAFTLHPRTTPKAIDITSQRPAGDEPSRGIYVLEGDRLRLAWASNGEAERPTRFASERDSGVTFLVLRRQQAARGVSELNADEDAAQLKKENERLRRELERVRKQLRDLQEATARVRAEAEKARAEERAARKNAEDQRQKAEAERRAADEARRAADQQRRRAEEEARRAREQAERAARQAEERARREVEKKREEEKKKTEKK